jgi:hypothetical protein
MAPRTQPKPRIATSAATQRMPAPQATPAPRQNQVLHSSRVPAQLPLFLRPSGAR